MKLSSIPGTITTIPQLVRNSTRAVEVVSILSKYGLADWVSRLDLKLFRDLFKSQRGDMLSHASREERVRLALLELGPTFIKLGQVLSTRPDLVGAEIASELQGLQADVPADPPDVVRAAIETELGQSPDDAFAEFDAEALASASIGQVHRARLKSGEEVVVKIQHDGIEKKVRVDLDILVGLAELAEYIEEFRNYRPRSVAVEFRRSLLRELDFEREERNMQQFERNFADDPTIRIPRTYPDLCTSRLLTMEQLNGVKLTDREALAAAGFDLEQLARRGAEIYIEMIFTHGFYHADPHPGNLLVMEGNVIGLLDYGMVGRIDDRLQEDFEDMLLAITGQDADQLTSIITRVGDVPLDLDTAALRAEVSDFVSHYASQALDEVDLSTALLEMTDIIRRYHIMLPTQVAMLIKVMIMLEGTGRLLEPKFHLLDVIRPAQRRMVLARFSPARQWKKWSRLYRELEHLAEALPRGIVDIMRQIQTGKFDVHLDHRGLEPSVNRLVLGMLASALFLGSALLWSQGVAPTVAGVPVLGVAGCVLSFLLGLRLLRAINKSGRLDRRQ